MEATSRDDARAWRSALIITIVAALVRFVFAQRLPLFPDETYYWDWSRHLAAGYFDHPPAIAVLIYAGTTLARLLGADASPLAIRFFPVVAGTIAALFTIRLAYRIGGGQAAHTAAWIFACMPLAASGLVLATPDAPLLAATAASLYFLVRAVQAPAKSNEALRHWVLAGIALGLAFSSKYTSILLPMTATVALVINSSLRKRLREAGPYLACVVATIVFLPVLYWNATHDWVSFLFQIQHGLGTPTGSAIKRELDLVGGQLGLVSPIIFALAAWALWRTLRQRIDDARFLLAIVATGSWVFFAWSALRKSVEANWPAPSYGPAIALLVSLPVSFRRDRWLRGGIGLGAVMVVLIYIHAAVPILPIPARRDPVARSAGWEGVAARVQEARQALGARTWVAADRYQDVSEIAYHLPDRPQVFCTCVSGRRNQYDLWPGFAAVAAGGDNLVVTLDETPAVNEIARRLAPYFGTVTRGVIAPLLRGADTVAVRRIWTFEGYRGGWPPRS